jgi:hypothetical protein
VPVVHAVTIRAVSASQLSRQSLLTLERSRRQRAKDARTQCETARGAVGDKTASQHGVRMLRPTAATVGSHGGCPRYRLARFGGAPSRAGSEQQQRQSLRCTQHGHWRSPSARPCGWRGGGLGRHAPRVSGCPGRGRPLRRHSRPGPEGGGRLSACGGAGSARRAGLGVAGMGCRVRVPLGPVPARRCALLPVPS